MTGARVSKLSLINLLGKGSWIAEALELALIIFLTSSSSAGLKGVRSEPLETDLFEHLRMQ